MNARRTILVGWELGGGMGHLARLVPILKDLRAQGWRVVAAMRDLKGARRVFKDLFSDSDPEGFQLRGGPFLFRSPGTAPAKAPHSLAEALVRCGLGDPRAVGVVVEAWRAVVREVKPDVVLADSAPSLNAAVRGTIPLIAIGNGWAMPPPGRPVPILTGDSGDAPPALRAEERVCGAFAAAAGRRASNGLADLLRGDVTFPCTPKLLDPYRAWRSERLFWPPELPVTLIPPGPRDGPALIYLPRRHPGQSAVIEAHARLGTPALAWFAGAKAQSKPWVTVSDGPLDLARLLPRSRHVVHHGGSGVAAWALALGVPQVILPTDLEKLLTARALETVGAGVGLTSPVSTQRIQAAIQDMQADQWVSSAVISSEDCAALATRQAVLRACEGSV